MGADDVPQRGELATTEVVMRARRSTFAFIVVSTGHDRGPARHHDVVLWQDGTLDFGSLRAMEWRRP